MIDEEHLTRLKLWKEPLGQKVVGHILGLNYRLPPVTKIVLEGIENIPSDRTVFFALNHTDRYNYWPFQYQMWRNGRLPFTTTWVKGKYYENPYLGWFFDQCNNIPLPSLGYLILQDARAVLDRKLDDDEYRLMRDLAEGRLDQKEVPETPAVGRLLREARRDFDPSNETYACFIQRWNDRLMALVEQRTLQALNENRNNVIVFPQGTRSLRLLPAKPGLAKFALRYEIPIVPVGSMGSEEAYPGGSPWASGGTCLYRIGKPLSVNDVLVDCRIDQPYGVFTREADAHSEKFERASRAVTAAIDELLDDSYKLSPEGEAESGSRAERLI